MPLIAGFLLLMKRDRRFAIVPYGTSLLEFKGTLIFSPKIAT